MAADIKELAISYWRMEKWLNNTNVERKMAASSALRTVKRYLDSNNIEVLDLLGQHFDSGLAVDVINNDVPEGTDDSKVIITEMLKPIIMQDGAVVQFGQVSIGLTVKKPSENNTTTAKQDNNEQYIKDMTSEILELSKYVKMQASKKYRVMGITVGTLLIIFMLINTIFIVHMGREMKNEFQNITTASAFTEDAKDDNLQPPQDTVSIHDEESSNLENENIIFKKYEIKPGDSLLTICKENGISYEENIEYIKNFNGITDINKIYVGQQILLPVNKKEEN